MLSLVLLLMGIAVADEYETIQADQADRHVGRNVTVCDHVTQVSHPSLSHVYFINFGPAWPNHEFTIVIWERDASRMEIDPVLEYSGKDVCVSGVIDRYQDRPQITLTDEKKIFVKRS